MSPAVPSPAVWRAVLDTITNNTKAEDVVNLATYYAKRYMLPAGREPDGKFMEAHAQIGQMRLPREFIEAGPRPSTRAGTFGAWIPTLGVIRAYSLAAPLVKIAQWAQRGYRLHVTSVDTRTRPGFTYWMTIPDPLSCIDFEISPDHGPQAREYVEALLHLDRWGLAHG